AKLLGGDALILVASHRSRHHLLTGQLDASILDEANPDARNPALDLYDSSNPSQPPYAAAFIETYRAAQLARNRRITAWAQQQLEDLRWAGRTHDEFGFAVHGTTADPRRVDPTT